MWAPDLIEESTLNTVFQTITSGERLSQMLSRSELTPSPIQDFRSPQQTASPPREVASHSTSLATSGEGDFPTPHSGDKAFDQSLRT
jgi:hypothetical protein